jgi:hypothetical protein
MTMFRIGSNLTPKILPAEVTEIQESPAAEIVQQETVPVKTRTTSAANTSIRGEAMMSSLAWKSQLNKQLSQAEAERQVNDETTYIKPFDGEEANKNATFIKPFSREDAIKNAPKILRTGDGDDQILIRHGSDGLIHVNVNGKDTWSGSNEDFQKLVIDTGNGNDVVTKEVYNSTNILTGDGDDKVTSIGFNDFIETGFGNDTVNIWGSLNKVNTGEGDDSVKLRGVAPHFFAPYEASGNEVDTGGGNDRVELEVSHEGHGAQNRIQTGDGIDYVRLSKNAEDNTVNTGAGDDIVDDSGLNNNVE